MTPIPPTRSRISLRRPPSTRNFPFTRRRRPEVTRSRVTTSTQSSREEDEQQLEEIASKGEEMLKELVINQRPNRVRGRPRDAVQ